MSEQLQHLHDLKPIASRMRERQEQINRGKANVFAHMADLIQLASEQGRDCLLAKTKLGRALRWSEWLHAHVPNITEDEANKYERITTEQLEDPRQCYFAFLPPADREERPKRSKASAWESACNHISRLSKSVNEEAIGVWPQEQVDLVRRELEPVARVLWSDKFL